MEIPIHQSGFVVVAIFTLMALVACALCWVICLIVDEWERAGWEGERVSKELADQAGEWK